MKIAGLIFTLALFAFMNLFSCTEDQEVDSQEHEQIWEQEEELTEKRVEYKTISGSNFGKRGYSLVQTSDCTFIDGEVYYCEDGKLKSLTDGEVIWAPDEFELTNVYYNDGKLYSWNYGIYIHTLSTGETRMIPDAFFDLPYRLFAANGRIYIAGWYSGEIGSYDETDGSYVAYDIVGHGEVAWCDGSLYVYAGDGIYVFDDTVKSGEVNDIGSPLVEGRKLDITPPDGIAFSGKVSDFGKLYIASDGSIIFTIGDNILRYDGKDCERLDVDCNEQDLLYVYKSKLYYVYSGNDLYSYDYLTGDVALVYEDIPGIPSLVGDRIVYSNSDVTFELLRLE